VGTGPGTQAVQLAQMGFDVTGTDLSQTAIEQARNLSDQAKFIQDDILNSKINDTFDFVFDRGCFHTLDPRSHVTYVKTMSKLLNSGGLLFLKTFSTQQQGDWGPHRFDEDSLRAIFDKSFEVQNSLHTVYQGTLDEQPKALFTVLRKVNS